MLFEVITVMVTAVLSAAAGFLSCWRLHVRAERFQFDHFDRILAKKDVEHQELQREYYRLKKLLERR